MIMKAIKKPTLIEQAITNVIGFEQINNKLERKVKLNSLSKSTYINYARAIARVSLHFNKTPLELSLDQIEDYLLLQKHSWRPSESYFKHTVCKHSTKYILLAKSWDLNFVTKA